MEDESAFTTLEGGYGYRTKSPPPSQATDGNKCAEQLLGFRRLFEPWSLCKSLAFQAKMAHSMRTTLSHACKKSRSLGWSKSLAPASFLQAVFKCRRSERKGSTMLEAKLGKADCGSLPHVRPWHRWHCVQRRLYSSSFWRKFSICSITT